MEKTYGIILSVISLDRKNIDSIAQTPEDKLLLAKIYDKINSGIQRNIPSGTFFLSQRELVLCKYLFGNIDGLIAFGGYEGAQRQILVFLPEYLDSEHLMLEDSPIVCLRAKYYHEDTPSHRDFLGALIGCGIARECIGDICVNDSFCDFFITAEIAPFILQNFTSAGRVKLHLEKIGLQDAVIPEAATVTQKDTLASLRLDNIICSGFKVSRTQAAQYIASGHAAINGLLCEKSDKSVEEGAVVTVRGLGKIRLSAVGGQSKKGRIHVVIDRYV